MVGGGLGWGGEGGEGRASDLICEFTSFVILICCVAKSCLYIATAFHQSTDFSCCHASYASCANIYVLFTICGLPDCVQLSALVDV